MSDWPSIPIELVKIFSLKMMIFKLSMSFTYPWFSHSSTIRFEFLSCMDSINIKCEVLSTATLGVLRLFCLFLLQGLFYAVAAGVAFLFRYDFQP